MEDFKKTVKKEDRNTGPITPTVRDIVMIISDVKINYSSFGGIVKINSPTTMMIRPRNANRNDLGERPVRQVVPILA